MALNAVTFLFPEKAVMLYLGATIPKLKTRQQGGSASGSQQQQQAGGGGGGQKKGKGKKGKR